MRPCRPPLLLLVCALRLAACDKPLFQGVHVIDPPNDTATAPQTQWSGSPYFAERCVLHVPGVSSIDPQAHYASSAGTLPGLTEVTAGPTGLTGTVPTLAAAQLTATWQVTDDHGSSSTVLREDLRLTVHPGAHRRTPDRPDGTLALSGLEGWQALAPGCATCTGRRGQLAVGASFTLALEADGSARVWGSNVGIPLGHGVLSDYGLPQPVCGGPDNDPCSAGFGTVTAITSGAGHTCALAGGTVYCWGSNGSHQAGPTGDGYLGFPLAVCSGGACPFSTPTAIVAGSAFTCILTASGEVWCWGFNSDGQLGSGSTDAPVGPVPVCLSGTGGSCVPLTGATALAAGNHHACAIVAGGEVRCWGAGHYGERGDGTTADAGNNPTAVCAAGAWDGAQCSGGALTGVTSIAAGSWHTCAVVAGEVQCWGDPTYGDLGNDATAVQTLPQPVCEQDSGGACPPLQGASAVVAGDGYSCALRSTGEVACWGYATDGQLGDGDTNDDQPRPVPVCTGGAWDAVAGGCRDAGSDSKLGGATTLAAGAATVCVLRAGGALWCWGNNDYGNAGQGSSRTAVSVAHPVCATGEYDVGAGGCRDGAADSALTAVDLVSVGDSYTCDVVAGAASCFGDNASGQLGHGGYDFITRPTHLCQSGDGRSCSPLGEVAALAAGNAHACAVSTSGGVSCWGTNYWGQLGNGTWDGVADHPGLVCATGSGTNCVPLAGVIEVSAGGDHTCALLATGEVRCWGRANCGQLGDGTSTVCDDSSGEAQNQPATVCATGQSASCEPLSGVVSLAASDRSSCALLASGHVVCWGAHDQAQLGDGAGGNAGDFATNPVPVCATGTGGTCVELSGITALAGGADHFCALGAAGAVKCWGYNATSALGDGTSSDFRRNPVSVCSTGATTGGCVPFTGAVAIAAGLDLSCAIDSAGGAWCWGDANYVGNAGVADGSHPSPVCAPDPADDCQTACPSELTGVVAIGFGGLHGCALTEDGSTVCWGNQQDGALGNGLVSDGKACDPVAVCKRGQGFGCADGEPYSTFATRVCDVLEVSAP